MACVQSESSSAFYIVRFSLDNERSVAFRQGKARAVLKGADREAEDEASPLGHNAVRLDACGQVWM